MKNRTNDTLSLARTRWKYISKQEQEDLITDQISMLEYYDPFRQWLESNLKKKEKSKK